jgi:hypothetical protein
MIEILGPTYRYRDEILTEPEVILIRDHHYDDINHCFHVKTLLDHSACDPQQHLLISDSVLHSEEIHPYKLLCLPIFLAQQSDQFTLKKIKTNWNNKTAAFGFMINKPRPNREFLLLLIKHFGLTNYTYSLCWKNTEIKKAHLLANVKLESHKKIIENTQSNIPKKAHIFGHEVLLDQGLHSGNITNSEIYTKLLQSTVFEPSCISLITEPTFYERETFMTEKTIMAMYGGTLPIWVGGWGIPKSMRQLGFDVFDDIVDHGYEHMEDPWDRVYHAVEKNLHLLKDIKVTQQFLKNNHDRLQHNVDLINSNVFQKHITDKIEKYDPATQRLLKSITQGQGFKNHLPKNYKLW